MTGPHATPPPRPPDGSASADDVGHPRVIDRLLAAPIEVVGQFTDASNATLLVRMHDRDTRSLEELADEAGRPLTLEDFEPTDLAVYKPRRGEAPLYDFPTGTLHRREIAAFVVSRMLGWDLVPETVLRADAPYGVGSMQRFIAHDPEQHYFTLLDRDMPALDEQLRMLAAFDVVINNADRKAGHVLLEDDEVDGGRVRGIDHGVSFHTEHKLRTVAWDFIDQPVPGRLLADVDRLRERLAGDGGAQLQTLLTAEEIAAMVARSVELVTRGSFPAPMGPRPTPWPLL